MGVDGVPRYCHRALERRLLTSGSRIAVNNLLGELDERKPMIWNYCSFSGGSRNRTTKSVRSAYSRSRVSNKKVPERSRSAIENPEPTSKSFGTSKIIGQDFGLWE